MAKGASGATKWILNALGAILYGALLIIFLPFINSFVENPIDKYPIVDFIIKAIILGVALPALFFGITIALTFTLLWIYFRFMK